MVEQCFFLPPHINCSKIPATLYRELVVSFEKAGTIERGADAENEHLSHVSFSVKFDWFFGSLVTKASFHSFLCSFFVFFWPKNRSNFSTASLSNNNLRFDLENSPPCSFRKKERNCLFLSKFRIFRYFVSSTRIFPRVDFRGILFFSQRPLGKIRIRFFSLCPVFIVTSCFPSVLSQKSEIVPGSYDSFSFFSGWNFWQGCVLIRSSKAKKISYQCSVYADFFVSLSFLNGSGKRNFFQPPIQGQWPWEEGKEREPVLPLNPDSSPRYVGVEKETVFFFRVVCYFRESLQFGSFLFFLF